MYIGELGIFYLKELWEKNVLEIEGDRDKNPLYQLILDGLGLGIIETIQFLKQHKPSFSDFEKWILKQRQGFINSEIIEKINRGVSNYLNGNHPVYPLVLEIEESVFTKKDLEFWEKHGYIVLKNAIPREDCKVLENAIWEYLDMTPNNPNMWNSRSQMFWIDNFSHPLIDKNRQSKKIHKAFTQIWGTDELFHSVNRLSFNPPLGDKYSQYGPNNLHWDASIAQPMPFDVIGLVYLNDVAENQGAFQCVSSFHKKIDDWIANLPDGTNPRDAILKAFETVKVSGNAGDLIICRQELPHGSSLNCGTYPRFVQYISMYPANRGINPIWK